MKTCRKCHREFDITNFYKDKSKKDGYGSWCKTCQYDRPKRDRTEYFKRYKRYFRGSKYGLTSEALDKMYAEQDHKCYICQEEKPLVIDHNHGTGEVRKLLCNYCNLIVGIVETAQPRISKAFQYVKQHSPTHRRKNGSTT